MYESVASHLSNHVVVASEDPDRDWFGRTCFNRYYYSAYLRVRSGLSEIEPKVERLGHKAYPEHLEATVRRDLKRALTTAKRVQDGDSIRTLSAGLTAEKELAEILRKGYSTRVVADYQVDTAVQYDERDFKLNSVPISAAKAWPSRADTLTQALVKAMRICRA